MKRQFFLVVLIAALMISCASTSTPNFSDTERNETSRTSTNISSPSSIEGNEWKLIGVFIDGRDTRFSRDTLPEELKNFFTLSFDAQNISGIGAPNRYSAPYTLGDSQTISIMLMRSTLMASFFQPENLSEHDFFVYLQSSYLWKLAGNNLELQSKTTDGGEVRLVFSQD